MNHVGSDMSPGTGSVAARFVGINFPEQAFHGNLPSSASFLRKVGTRAACAGCAFDLKTNPCDSFGR